jgi:hypothetical protein
LYLTIGDGAKACPNAKSTLIRNKKNKRNRLKIPIYKTKIAKVLEMPKKTLEMASYGVIVLYAFIFGRPPRPN